MARLAPREDDPFQTPPSIMRAQLAPKPPIRDHPSQRPHESEISIFDAEKYFNGVHDPNNKPTTQQPDIPTIRRLSLSSPKQSVSSVSRLSSVSDDSYGRNYRARSFHATPTASSEASWNSQTGLLTHPPNLPPISIRNLNSAADRSTKKPGASTWFLRGNICPCSGKKSVNVKHSSSDTETSKLPPTPPPPPRIVQLNRITSSGGNLYPSRQSSPLSARATLVPDQPTRNFVPRPHLDQNKFIMATTITNPTGNGFTFPILNYKTPPPATRTPVVGDDNNETPRDSIEVFQPRSPKSRRASYDDDVCSDASSDLFEIESFSTIRRDSLDDPAANFNVRRLQITAFNKSAAIGNLAEFDEEEAVTPSVGPTECYPPSEVSVDWSVTTAEGFSVAGSEFGFPALRKQQPPKFSDEIKKKGNGGGGLLTSCRCEKAVNVAEIRPAVGPARSNVGHRHSL